MARLALIDVGTNTLRLVIGEQDENQTPRFLFQEVFTTRLGEGLGQSNELSKNAISRTLEGLKKLQTVAHAYGIKMPEAYATAWARKASNTDEALSAIAEINLPVWILTPEEEALMGLEAVKLMDSSLTDYWMIDIGGGSTEIIEVIAGMPKQIQSMPLGAVNVPSYRGQVLTIVNGTCPHFAGLVVALGGTAACLAALKIGTPPQDPAFFAKAQGLFLEAQWIRNQLESLAAMPLEERKKLPGMEIERADILPGGTQILSAFLTQVKAEGTTICLYSFVHGLLAKRLEASIKI